MFFVVTVSLAIVSGIYGMSERVYGNVEPWKPQAPQYVYPMQYVPFEHQGRTFADDFNVDRLNPLKWFSSFSKGAKKHDIVAQVNALYKMTECLILKKNEKECEKLLMDSKDLFVTKKTIQQPTSTSSTTPKTTAPELPRTTESAPLSTGASVPRNSEEDLSVAPESAHNSTT